MSDDLSKLRARLDQMGALLADLAPVIWQFYSALKKEGFVELEALELTKAWLVATLRGTSERK